MFMVALFAKDESCYSIQLYSFLDTLGEADTIDASIYPKECKVMHINNQYTLRCECKNSYKQAYSIRKKYHKFVSDVIIVQTYKKRFDVNVTLETPIVIEENLVSTPLPKMDKKSNLSEDLLRLTLQVMLYSGDLKNALMIVQQGVNQFPSSPWWNEQAAQIALWNGNSSDALNYYLKFYTLTPTSKTRKDIQALAGQLQNQDVLIQMLKEAIWFGEENNISKLVNAYQNNGNLSQGAEFFGSLYTKNKDKNTLKAKIGLLQLDRKTSEAQTDYDIYVKAYGFDQELDIRFATIAFSERKIDLAYNYLHRHAQTIAHNRDDYWHFYIEILWFRRTFDELYAILYERYNEHLLRAFDKDRLALLALSYDKKFASDFALKTFLKEQKTSSFFTFIFLAKEQKAFSLIESTIDTLDEQHRLLLEKMAEFWILKGEIAIGHRLVDKADGFYQKAIEINPNNTAINVTYGWFLLEQNRIDSLQKWLKKIEKEEKSNSIEYALLSASAYLKIQNSDKAKGYVEKLLSTYPNDPTLYVLYSDVLNLWSDKELAYKYQYSAWKNMNRALDKNPLMEKNSEFLGTYLRLGMQFEPQKYKKWIQRAKKGLSKEAYNNFVLGVAVIGSNDEAIAYAKKRVQKNEPWLELYMAFSENDIDKMSKTVLSHAQELPIADRVQAAYQAGNHKDAFSLGIQGLNENPNNNDLYGLLYNYWMQDYTKLRLETSYIYRSPLIYQEIDLRVNPPLIKGYDSHIEFRHRNQKSDNIENLPTVPSQDQEVLLGLKKRSKFVDTEIEMGYRKSLQSFWTGQIKAAFHLPFYNFNLQLKQHADADESVYLSVGGYKNTLEFDGMYSLTNTLQLAALIKENSYYGADEVKAGSGCEYSATISKLLRSGYPDFGVHGSLGYYGYNQSNEILGTLETVLPSNETPVLPNDYTQMTLGMFYGTGTREYFIKQWRPYINTDIAYNTENGFGYTIVSGIGGMLLKDDRLSMEVSYSSNIGVFSNDYYKLSFLYFLYGW